ncbi:replication stress response regulator SDE2 [Diprion similis]|uniref:replication stress response regulator SDE2 n=1 Tax=Diprion similis TaxID=362088 RepID=UPI001EF9379E|nr:replication stress response regulator SDE2 [Diprion similis]
MNMSEVQITVGISRKTICSIEEGVTAEEIGQRVAQLTGLGVDDFYILHNGRLVRGTDLCEDGVAAIVPRLPGGKGGFGSMLRAIGAQIEKTTNREACRDLSGRRLRDINEEKRLKSWIDKQATREEEAAERKKRKLERLCAQPKHEFKDKNYENERSTLTEKVGDAVEEGFKMAMAGSSGVKRKNPSNGQGGRKKLALDSDIDSDELGSSSDDNSDLDSASDVRVKSGSISFPETHGSQNASQVKSNDAKVDDTTNSKKPQDPGEASEGHIPVSDENRINRSTQSLVNEAHDDSLAVSSEVRDKQTYVSQLTASNSLYTHVVQGNIKNAPRCSRSIALTDVLRFAEAKQANYR